MKKLVAICVAALLLQSCIFHYSPRVRPRVDAKTAMFLVDLEYPGDVEFKKLEADGLEYRGADLLNYTRVISFIEQRNQLQDTSKLILDEYAKTIEYTNRVTEEYNDAEQNLSTMAYVSTASIVGNIVLVLLLVLLL